MKKIIVGALIILFLILFYNSRNIYNLLPNSVKLPIKASLLKKYDNLGDKPKMLLRILNLDPFKGLQKRYGRSNPQINNLDNDYNVKFLPETASSKFDLIKHKIDFKIQTSLNNDSGYGGAGFGFFKPFFLEIFEGKLLVINNNAEILISNIDDKYLNKKNPIKFETLNNDLELDGSKNFRVTGSLIDNNKLYLSHLTLEKDCQKFNISVADLNFEKLMFEIFFKSDSCGINLNAGRMASFELDKKKGILFTVGGEKLNEASLLPQNPNSDIGKIIFLDFEKQKKIIYSIGHRNPQGLFAENNIVIATEHGPKGGDEINKILLNKNYGWPIASYGYAYTHRPINSDRKYLKSHRNNGFEEPIYSFVPSIGISQIIKIDDDLSENWKGDFLLSSLNAGSLYRIKFSEDFNKVIFTEKIFINRRIRDLKYSKKLNAIILAMEDWRELGILKEVSEN